MEKQSIKQLYHSKMASAPWQARWKQPKLHSVRKRNGNVNRKSENNAKLKDDCICGAASSELTVNESDQLIRHIKKETNIENISSQSPYILNVVVSTSSKSAQSNKEETNSDFHEPIYGDEFVLSLCNTLQTTRKNNSEKSKEENVEDTELNEIYSRPLRWPSSAFAEDNNVDERGIVSICFCRISESALKNFGLPLENDSYALNKNQYMNEEDDEDFDEKIADAMDTLHLLSLFDSPLSEEGHANRDTRHERITNQDNMNQNNHEISAKFNLKEDGNLNIQSSMKTASNMDSEKKLVLCCLTNNGHVHLFVALDLLINTSSSYSPDMGKNINERNLQHSFASLFLGNTIYQNLEKYVLPLSNPIASIPLTMCRFFSQQKKQLLMDDRDIQTNNHIDRKRKINFSNFSIPNSLNLNFNFPNSLDLTFFDATMDITYYQYQTFANKATFCTSSNDFIAVCGKGFRKRHQGYLARQKSKMKGAFQYQHDTSPGKNKEENTNKNNFGQKGTTEEGGFISFISLRHCSETKSLFLPFVPSKITPVEWQGMHLFICLRDPKSQIQDLDFSLLNQLDKSDVIVIRVDASSKREHHIQFDSNVVHSSINYSENKNHSYIMEDTNFKVSNDENTHEIEEKIQSSLKSHSNEEQVLQHLQSLPLQRLRRFKLIPLFGSLKEILKSSVISLPSESNENDINDKSCLNHLKIRTLDINMNAQSKPPSLVAVHEIEFETKRKKIATLHRFDELALLLHSTSAMSTESNKGHDFFPENENGELVIKTSTKQRFFAFLEEKQNDFKNKTNEETADSWCLGGQVGCVYHILSEICRLITILKSLNNPYCNHTLNHFFVIVIRVGL